MTVISGNRTEEFHLIQLTPGRIPHNAVCHGAGNCIEHYVQTGVAEDNDVVRIHFGDRPQKSFGFRNTVRHAVVPAIHSCLTFQIGISLQDVHHFHGDIQLIHARFPSGHIQGQTLGLNVRKLLIQLLFQSQQFFSAHFTVFLHNLPPRAVSTARRSCRRIAGRRKRQIICLFKLLYFILSILVC